MGGFNRPSAVVRLTGVANMPDIIYLPPDDNLTTLFERFYYQRNPEFFRAVLNKVPNRDFDVTREICQQVWTEVWQGVVGKTYTYLSPGLLLCKAASRVQDHRRRAARYPQLDPSKHDRAETMNIDDNIDYRQALAAIPEGERMVFSMFFRDGLTQVEIAKRLEISTRTVRRRLDAALKHLREVLCASSV
jgi:RNA polymerase sigma factor (sigma-70 family)